MSERLTDKEMVALQRIVDGDDGVRPIMFPWIDRALAELRHLRSQRLTASDEIFERGFWRPCVGCHEHDEGHPTGPYNETLRCHLGNGCHECGGIGATWERNDLIAAAGGE